MSFEPRQFTPGAVLGRPRARAARIIASDGTTVRACTVANLSQTGATLRLAEAPTAASRFALLIDDEHQPRHCELAWRAPAELGVRFLHPGEVGAAPRCRRHTDKG